MDLESILRLATLVGELVIATDQLLELARRRAAQLAEEKTGKTNPPMVSS